MKKQRVFIFLVSMLTFLFLVSCTTSEPVKKVSEEERLKKIELENERIAQEKAKEREKLITHYKYEDKWYKKENFPANIHGIKKLSLDNPCFMNNNPYGFEEDIAYAPIIQGSVLQWISDGCLYDFAGVASSQLYWSCLAYIRIPDNQRNMLFNESQVKFFQYVGTYSYKTTGGGTNTVPVFDVIYY